MNNRSVALLAVLLALAVAVPGVFWLGKAEANCYTVTLPSGATGQVCAQPDPAPIHYPEGSGSMDECHELSVCEDGCQNLDDEDEISTCEDSCASDYSC